MILPDGYSDVPAGKIAAVTTHLEMTARPALGPDPAGAWTLRRVDAPALEWYRDLYGRVGGPWLWVSRTRLPDAELAAIIQSPLMELHALAHDGRDEGLLEMDFREPDQCEIVSFGLTEKLVGTGAGRWLMNRAQEIAWSHPINRLWLHTCSFDHPAALAFYHPPPEAQTPADKVEFKAYKLASVKAALEGIELIASSTPGAKN
jgi:GNAT superfamily N-acetyltransferase